MPPIPLLNPNMMQQAGMVNPFVPPVPPPPSPTLGFSLWAQDPRNGMKIMPSMTDQDRRLQPGLAAASPPPLAPTASANPPSFASIRSAAAQPPAPTPAPADLSAPINMPTSNAMVPPTSAPRVGFDQLGYDQDVMRQYQKGSGGSQVRNPWLRGLATAGDIAGSMLLGRGMMAIPGSTAHNIWLQDQQAGRVAQDQSALQAQAQLADTQSQTTERTAKAAKEQAQSEAYAPVMLTPEQANAIGYPDLAGQSMDPRHVAVLMAGKQKTDSAAAIATGKNQTTQQIADEKNKRIQATADAANKTKLLLQDKKDTTSTANTSARIAAKGTPGAPGVSGGKVPADVTKRAALAGNVMENADAITGIINAHPEIVGPAGGRYSNVQQMIGSDDPNIQELGVRMHNVALASNGAHGLRSAEAVAQTEKELFNNFKTGPHGIAGGLKGLTDSVQTFLQDESNFQNSGRRTGNAMQPPNAGGPKIGDTKSFPNGKKGRWDGTGWEAQ